MYPSIAQNKLSGSDFSYIFKCSGSVSFNFSKQILVELIISWHNSACYKASVKWKPSLPPTTICSPKITLCKFLMAVMQDSGLGECVSLRETGLDSDVEYVIICNMFFLFKKFI